MCVLLYESFGRKFQCSEATTDTKSFADQLSSESRPCHQPKADSMHL